MARNWGLIWMVHAFTNLAAFLAIAVFVEGRGLPILWLPGPRRAPGSWLGDGIGTADDLAALRYWVPDLAERDVYVCGPEEWTETVRRVTQAAGLPSGQLHIEKFRW